MLEATTLKLSTPCHGSPIRLRALRSVPREVYDRTCGCGFGWKVTRETVQEGAVRIDKVTWEAGT